MIRIAVPYVSMNPAFALQIAGGASITPTPNLTGF
jgi:hypothetical protein